MPISYKLSKSSPEGLMVLSLVEAARGNFAAAIRMLDDAITKEPLLALIHQRASFLLSCGDYLRGFKDIVWSGYALETDHPLLTAKLWDGSPVEHLTLGHTGGYGDALMYSRYLPLIEDRAANITLLVPEPLRRLMARAFPKVSIPDVGQSPQVPEDDLAILIDLPRIFETTLATVPPPTNFQYNGLAKRNRRRRIGLC
jgi:hypothetical protein